MFPLTKKRAIRQTRGVMMATAFVLAIALAVAFLSASVVTTMRDAADRIDANRSVAAVQAAVSSIKKRLGATVRDNAVWDDAYAAVSSQEADAWIYDNWGSTSEDYPLYDGAIVLDATGAQVKAYLKGEEFDAASTFGSRFVRRAIAASRNRSPDPLVDVYPFSGRVMTLATMAIQPFAEHPDNGEYKSLTFFKELTPDYVATISEDFQIEGLALNPAPHPDQLNLALDGTSGHAIGYLNWPEQRPGSAVYEQVKPRLAMLIALFVLFLVVVVAFSALELRKERAIAARAAHDASHDYLTGLLNRVGLIGAIGAAREGSSVVHLVDLDGFKAVNDTWGHAVGDELIRLVAGKLATIHPDVVAAARLGGDEFALIQQGPSSPAELGERIVRSLAEPFDIDGRTVEVGASVGFAAETTGLAELEIIRRADMALYRAKEDGRGQVVAFDEQLDREREDRAFAEKRLKTAIDEDEIQIVFQPLIAAADGEITGVEALARWAPPTGTVSPEVFIPLAEKSGLIETLTRKMLLGSIRAVSCWQSLELSVNVSPIQLCNPNFAGEVKKMLSEEGFDANRLILEVTEGVLISKPDRARRSIDALRAVGVRFAMDDFGTGHASIGTLRQFGFCKVKIDRSLMSSNNDEVLKATIHLASALDIPVTAEGIETEEQARTAREAGCQLLQGHLCGKPMTVEQLRGRLMPDAHPGQIG
ncbi:bifunctional diguanylate cyclase/phosphodiesterase [Ciceribacter ferrooxidans]|uniref:EAL domain-containing protein n=1 Tax=Ciceribacter ferrooxidans TaxID=2509717 RepID=A0A4Q2T757_9HYPH|nr:EAL domain-containing protein [Ciceribacter ferrooxidans]RYC13993.1 EAL domain-containing protein [Ciceribacter ferrooxidans]